MPLTPADIHNTVFGKSPVGKRGYDEEQVDALLDEVSAEMIALLEESDALQRQVTTPDPRFSAETDARLDAALDAVATELRRATAERSRAEQRANALRTELDEARRAAAIPAPAAAPVTQLTDRVLARAQSTADDYVKESRAESSQLLSQAREQAERTLSEAQAAGLVITGDAKRRHDEALAQVQGARAALQQEIDGLTRLATGYHDALRKHLDRQDRLADNEVDAG